MTAPAIPIENLYYIFCYAWGRFEEGQSVLVGAEKSPDLPNLLARVLVAATHRLLRRGLDRAYQPAAEDLPTVRGRILLDDSIRLKVQHVPRLACVFDELSHDVLHNQILKATLARLVRLPTLNRGLAHELRRLSLRFSDVSNVRLQRADFRRVQLHRNNAYYDLVLKICELLFDQLLPTQDGSGFRFADVLRDEQKMALVFEAFVRNFYRSEQSQFAVEPLQFAWDAEEVSTSGIGRLPLMKTDIYLRSPERRIIIDTKYYTSALQETWGSKSFRSENLYQLFAYLKNVEARGEGYKATEGILLYPAVREILDAHYRIQGHAVRIATVNLDQPWQGIASQLLHLVPSSSTKSRAS